MNDREIKNEKRAGLGNVLKLLRIAREMTTKELASKMNVSSTYICEVESNNKKPSLDMLDKYSEVLEIKRSTILYFDEEIQEHGYNYQKLLFQILQKIIEK